MSYDSISVHSTKANPGISWELKDDNMCVDLGDGTEAVIYHSCKAAEEDKRKPFETNKDDICLPLNKPNVTIKTSVESFWFYNRNISQKIGVDSKSKYCAWVSMYLFVMDATIDPFIKNYFEDIHKELANKVSRALANVREKTVEDAKTFTKQPETVTEFVKSFFKPIDVKKIITYHTADETGVNLNSLTKNAVRAVQDKLTAMDLVELEYRNAVSFFSVNTLKANGSQCLKIFKP